MPEWEGRDMQRQPYTGFEFVCDYGKQFQESKGVHSSQLNFYRVSDGSRYNEDMSAAFQDKTVQAPGRDGTFYFGTNYTSRVFNIQIAFDSMTEDDMTEFKRIFAAKQEGDLIFDETPYKQYHVKIQSPPQMKYIVFDEPFVGKDPVDLISTKDLERTGTVDNSWRQGNRVYKGEGTIQFIAYYPYAIERYGRYKYLSDYYLPSSNNLLPRTYYDGFYKKISGVTFTVIRTNKEEENVNRYGGIVMRGTSDTKFHPYFYLTDPNGIELKKGVTYYMRMAASNRKNVYMRLLNVNTKKIALQINGNAISTETADGWKSFTPTEDIRARAYLYLNSNATFPTTMSLIFPVLTSDSDALSYTKWSEISEHYNLSNISLDKPRSWAFDAKTWEQASRMMIDEFSTELPAYDTPYVATDSANTTSSIYIPAKASVYSKGQTVIRVYNAGEEDSDLTLYFPIKGTSDSQIAVSKIDLLKATTTIPPTEVGASASPTTEYEIINTITFASMDKLYSTDEAIRFNGHTNLLEGGQWVRDPKTQKDKFYPSGALYNRYITSGSFFKIPAYQPGVEYFIVGTPNVGSTNSSAITTNTYYTFSRSLEYHHVYY